MTSSFRKIDPEWVVAIAAVMISLCALGVSIFQTQLMKKQQAYTVWPHLQIYDSNIDGLNLTIVNKGVGPGIIEEVSYTFEDQSTNSIVELIDLITKADPTVAPDSSIAFQYSNVQGTVLAPNDEHLLFDVSSPEAEIIYRAFEKIDFRLCYRSIQEDYWHIQGFLSSPERGCP